MSTKQLGIHDDILHKEADYAVKRLLLSSNGPPTAVFNALHQSTLNVTLMLAYNYRIEDPEDPFLAKIFELITISIENNDHINDHRAFLPFTMSIVDWWKQKYKQLVRIGTELRPTVLQQLASHGLKSDRECLTKVLDAIRDGKDIDDETVRSLCCKCCIKCTYESCSDICMINYVVELVAAGTGTTAVAMTWVLVILCNQPNDQEKIQAEIDAFIKIHDRIPTFNDRDHLPLFMSAIKECMRLRPIAPLALAHQAADDGNYIRNCLPAIYAMSHCEEKLLVGDTLFLKGPFFDQISMP